MPQCLASPMDRWPLVELAFALSACAPMAPPAPPPPPPIVAFVPREVPPAPIVEDDAAAPLAPPPPPVVVLDDVWLETSDSTTPYRVAMDLGTGSRARPLAALGLRDGGALTPAAFERIENDADTSSRWFAMAYRAADASPSEKVAAVLAAAETALDLADRLEAAGLSQVPEAWRADPSLSLTFEDVAEGPSRRMREEGLALVQLCIEAAGEVSTNDASAAKCRALRSTHGRVEILRANARDADAGGCRCHAGDPLCTENAAWCARR